METTRRRLFQVLGASLAIDWDRFLWTPNEKHIVIPTIILPKEVSNCVGCQTNRAALIVAPKTAHYVTTLPFAVQLTAFNSFNNNDKITQTIESMYDRKPESRHLIIQQTNGWWK